MGPPLAPTSSFATGSAWVWLGVLLAGAFLSYMVIALLRHRAVLRRRLRAANSKLVELRTRDPLTGLMTRPDFEARLDEAVAACDRGARPAALLVVGLDNFRTINEGYGHQVGDAVLTTMARRLSAFSPAPLAVCRLGGDEFSVLLDAGVEQAGTLGRRLAELLRQPFTAEGTELQMSASVGVAVYPDHGSRPRLPGCAALAMRSVKQVGGAGHAMYDPAMAVDQREQAELLQELRHAVERRQLELVYQPKVDARTLQITAAEALLRWQHPQRGTISPAVFIPLAERHGLIVPIGRWVLSEVCRQAAQWRGLGLRMRVAVNVSGHQLRQEDFVRFVLRQLAEHGIPPSRLTCEITETVAMEDTAHTLSAFERLRKAGLHVSIDDFGTGHSSLASLRRLPAAELKIDRAFVQDLASGDNARSIVQAIVQMARTLGLRVVAEGVETTEQRDALVALGCDELQGFLFARPMSATALALWADGDDAQAGSAAMFRPSLFQATAPAPMDGQAGPGVR
ncbi:MAG: bifunctional diguanylate cyclase/phosphodiesterase [Rubrivivax sp.]|nr:bifunctional diguanylate cyclase/phosphodiesterase [Rubrivivax sp.]